VNDPCYDIGGGAPPKDIKVKDPTWYLKSNSNNVIPTHMVVHKKCKDSASTIYPTCNPLSQWVAHFFNWYQLSSDLIGITYLLWKMMTKGERFVQKIWNMGSWWFGHGHGQRGSNIEEKDGSKFLNVRST